MNANLDTNRILDETFVGGLDFFDTVNSTNTTARALAVEACPHLVVAGSQTAGRGQRGARWWTGPGSLAMSLVLAPDHLPSDPRRGPLLALVTGLSVLDCVRPLLKETEKNVLGLHWPNDIFLDRCKLAGILIESTADGRSIVGIGINTNCRKELAPAELQEALVTLADVTGSPVNHTELIIRLLKSLKRGLETLKERPATIVEAADRANLQKGRLLEIGHGTSARQGRYAGIAEDGALMVETLEGIQIFHSGPARIVEDEPV